MLQHLAVMSSPAHDAAASRQVQVIHVMHRTRTQAVRMRCGVPLASAAETHLVWHPAQLPSHLVWMRRLQWRAPALSPSCCRLARHQQGGQDLAWRQLLLRLLLRGWGWTPPASAAECQSSPDLRANRSMKFLSAKFLYWSPAWSS